MADKKDLFDKYKIIGENGEEKYVPMTIDEISETLEEASVTEGTTEIADDVATVEDPIEHKEDIVDITDETPAIEETDEDKEFANFELKVDETEELESDSLDLASEKNEGKAKDPKKGKLSATLSQKEKKVKEPKPPKEKKIKEPKPKKEEIEFAEPITKKDHITFGLAIFALVLAIAFICVKYFPMGDNTTETPEPTTEIGEKLSTIQIQREGASEQYVQSDIDNVFYTFSPVYKLQYYQYHDNRMNPIQPAGTVTANVEIGTEALPITIDYVKIKDEIFGIGLFRAESSSESYLHNTVAFKLVDLPKGHEAAGKALLLAITNTEPISQKYNVWTDSFIIDLNTGETSRFLTNTTSFSVLTNEGYTSSNGKVPFFTAREYDENSKKKDIFVKNGTVESVFASDVYGDYVFADGNAIIYVKASETGLNVVRKEDGKETIMISLYDDFNTNYLYHNEYLLDKFNGKLYNVKTAKETAIAGYRMGNPEMMSISPDGKYLVVLGTANNVIDYQIHIFDLETGDYAKYEEKNFSQHANLAFIDNTTAIYTAVDPNQGYEYVIFDVSKAFKN